jgi:hypothetical protein
MRAARAGRIALAAGAGRIAFAAIALAGCATPPIAAGVPKTVDGLVIAPYALHEACMSMARGDKLDWRYESGAPIAFEVHYREGGAVLSPVVRDDSSGDSGTFEAREPRDYCVQWEAGASGAIVSYRLLLRAAPRQAAE